MFFQRARLKSAAATAVQSMLEGFVARGGIPERIWTDPYAIGWISGFAISNATGCAIRNGLSEGDVGKISAEILLFTWERITPKQHSMKTIRLMAKLANQNNAEFMRGSDAAIKTVTFSNGGATNLEDFDIVEALQTASLLTAGGVYSESSRSVVTAILLNQLFYAKVHDG